MEKIFIKTDDIKLDQFLKLSGAVMTGGEVKLLINESRVKINGKNETARRKKIHKGDIVAVVTEGKEEIYKVS